MSNAHLSSMVLVARPRVTVNPQEATADVPLHDPPEVIRLPREVVEIFERNYLLAKNVSEFSAKMMDCYPLAKELSRTHGWTRGGRSPVSSACSKEGTGVERRLDDVGFNDLCGLCAAICFSEQLHYKAKDMESEEPVYDVFDLMKVAMAVSSQAMTSGPTRMTCSLESRMTWSLKSPTTKSLASCRRTWSLKNPTTRSLT